MSIDRHKPYRHTDIEDDEIRLLILEPEGPEGWKSDLQAQLKTFVLTVERGEYNKTPAERRPKGHGPNTTYFSERKNPEAPRYDALSYTWGGDDHDALLEAGSFVHIFECMTSRNSGPNNSPSRRQRRDLGYIKLTKNLEAALRNFRTELRQPRAPLRLWVDSLCIRQYDNHYEKSNQIGKMADIYTEAERVRVWLGQDQAAFADLREFIKQILTLEKFDQMCTTQNAPRWNALRNLMQSPWFQRRWIVQEIAFARTATIHWGTHVIPWNELASAVQLFVAKRDTLRKMFHMSGELHHDPDFIGEVEAYGATNLVDRIDKMLRKSEDGNIMDLLMSLETILTTMTAFEVSKPHDIVYAIIQLSNDARPVSNRTMPQEDGRKNSADNGAGAGLLGEPIKLVLSHHEHEVPESSEGINQGGSTLQPIDHEILSSTGSWMTAEELERGRPQARKAPADTHLAVRGDANVRSRSRGRSPASAKSIREKAYRKPMEKFVVDYDKSVLKLCTEVIRFVTDRSKSLDILVKPWAPELSQRGRETSEHEEDRVCYPSWIQPASRRPFYLKRSAEHQKSIRIRADNLAGAQHPGFKTYDASGCVPPERPSGVKFIDGRILSTSGSVLDRIDKIAEPAMDATIPARWLKLGWHDRNTNGEELPPEEFWRTLVANRQSSNGPTGPPLYWRQACQWAFSQQAVNGNLNISELIYNRGISGHVSEPVGEFLQRVRSVIWDRALIRTESDDDSIGFLGLVPKEAQKDDLICILYGCSVPVVLRKKVRKIRKDKTPSLPRKHKRRRFEYEDDARSSSRHSRASSVSSGTTYNSTSSENQGAKLHAKLGRLGLDEPELEEYSLIGEAYIHGMMDGEAFSHLERRDLLEEKVFRIGCAVDCSCHKCEPPALTLYNLTEED